jgi:phosphoglycolate phosphatase-like HAD superfamily hydrolase
LSKRAIIDIDNTLWQFSDAFYLELKKINNKFPTPDHWCTYDIWEGYCSVEDLIAAINTIHHNQDSDRYQPYPESRDFLASLREHGCHIIIASHRTSETSQPTERWLARHRLPYDELHLSLDKTVLFPNVDIVVDDSPMTLEKAIESGALGAGLSFPWNRAYASNGFRLFSNLNEVLDYILKPSLAKRVAL